LRNGPADAALISCILPQIARPSNSGARYGGRRFGAQGAQIDARVGGPTHSVRILRMGA